MEFMNESLAQDGESKANGREQMKASTYKEK